MNAKTNSVSAGAYYGCLDRISEQEDGKRHYANIVLQITKAFAPCGRLEAEAKLACC